MQRPSRPRFTRLPVRLRSSVVLATLLLFLFSSPALAYVASSTNYRLDEDSINTGGGLSTSTSYRLEDTHGEAGSGTSTSASYNINAGYQQMSASTTLSLSLSGNLSLSPAIPTTGGGTANTSGVWTVGTNNPTGYTMTIAAAASPALVSGPDNFADYVPAGAAPDFAFATPAASSTFGFTPEGNDIVARYHDNGVTCNAGVTDAADACWDGLSLAGVEISRRASPTPPGGSDTTVKFRASSDTANIQAAGSYSASVTITVLAL